MDPPPTTALAAVSSAPHLPCADSIESSPRSRTTDSWENPLPPVPGATKLRLMCSHGGHIVPRPHDKALCYVGGDTRMVVADRSISLADLSARLAKTLLLQTKPFSLKYQLPNEDLDSLISLADDEDLENMIEEYDRICAAAAAGGGKGSRLRLFVFPAKSESIPSIGSLLDNSVKSDEWFLSALNGSQVLSGGFSDSTSVNCLLGLENDVVAANNDELGISKDSGFRNGKNSKASNQDVHSVPDSPMMETTSSFGSTNSTPSQANLPQIRVREDGGESKAQDPRLGIEDQFRQTNFSAAENFAAMSKPPPFPTTIIASMPIQTTVTSSVSVAGDIPSRVVSDDEKSDHGVLEGLCRKQPQPQSQVQLQQMEQKPCDNSSKPDSPLRDGSLLLATPQTNQMGYQEVIQVSSGENRISASQVDQRNNLIDPNSASIHLQKQVQGFGYMDPNNGHIQLQQQPQNYSYQQQFVHAGTHYVIPQPGNPMAMPAYYPVYPHLQAQHPHHQPQPIQQLHPQQYPHPVYIVQAPQPLQSYNTLNQQPTYPDGTTVVHTGQLQTPHISNGVPESANSFSSNHNVSRAAPQSNEASLAIFETATAATAAQPVVQLASKLPQQQFVNYSQVNQPRVITAPSPAYSYEIPDPARSQIYFTQPLDPSLITQYQTMASAQGIEPSSQLQNDTLKASKVRNL